MYVVASGLVQNGSPSTQTCVRHVAAPHRRCTVGGPMFGSLSRSAGRGQNIDVVLYVHCTYPLLQYELDCRELGYACSHPLREERLGSPASVVGSETWGNIYLREARWKRGDGGASAGDETGMTYLSRARSRSSPTPWPSIQYQVSRRA